MRVGVGTVTRTWRQMLKAMRMLGAMRVLRTVQALVTMWVLETVQANLRMLSWLWRQIWWFAQGP